jgi:hypothetical protein
MSAVNGEAQDVETRALIYLNDLYGSPYFLLPWEDKQIFA